MDTCNVLTDTRFCYFQARASVDSLKAWKISQLPLLTTLSSELTVQRENLIYHLGEEWKALIIWRLPPSKGNASAEIRLKGFKMCYKNCFINQNEVQATWSCFLSVQVLHVDIYVILIIPSSIQFANQHSLTTFTCTQDSGSWSGYWNIVVTLWLM